jgi:biotin transporter BioY
MLLIVAIGWMYVVLMMSVAESSAIAGVMTFLLYGVLPISVILYLLNTPKRRQRRMEEENLRRLQLAAQPQNEEQVNENL